MEYFFSTLTTGSCTYNNTNSTLLYTNNGTGNTNGFSVNYWQDSNLPFQWMPLNSTNAIGWYNNNCSFTFAYAPTPTPTPIPTPTFGAKFAIGAMTVLAVISNML